MKKYKKILIIILNVVLLLIICTNIYLYIRVKTAKIEVKLVSNLKIEFNEDIKISDLIVSINGKILDDRKINTTKLGKQTISFNFKNNDGIKVSYSFQIEVVDTIEPLIWITGQGNSCPLFLRQTVRRAFLGKRLRAPCLVALSAAKKVTICLTDLRRLSPSAVARQRNGEHK